MGYQICGMKRMDSILMTAFCPFTKDACREDCAMLSGHVHTDEDLAPKYVCLIASAGEQSPFYAPYLEGTEVIVW